MHYDVFIYRWLKFEEDVEDGGERWSKPYVATLSLHSLFELRSCILNGTVMLDMRANSIEEIAGKPHSPFKDMFIFLSTVYLKKLCSEKHNTDKAIIIYLSGNIVWLQFP